MSNHNKPPNLPAQKPIGPAPAPTHGILAPSEQPQQPRQGLQEVEGVPRPESEPLSQTADDVQRREALRAQLQEAQQKRQQEMGPPPVDVSRRRPPAAAEGRDVVDGAEPPPPQRPSRQPALQGRHEEGVPWPVERPISHRLHDPGATVEKPPADARVGQEIYLWRRHRQGHGLQPYPGWLLEVSPAGMASICFIRPGGLMLHLTGQRFSTVPREGYWTLREGTPKGMDLAQRGSTAASGALPATQAS